MFFIIYILLGFLYFLPQKNMLITFISLFFISISILLTLYYIIIFFYTVKNKNIILNTYSFPLYVFSSNIKFENIFKNFIFSNINIIVLTDKQKIIFKIKDNYFKTPPFYAGYHKIMKFYITFSDPLNFFTFRLNLKKRNFYNFFIKNKDIKVFDFFNEKAQELKEKKIKDDSIILRDYISGDDPRKIFWKSYALTDELKIKEDWFEKSSQNKIKIAINGIYNIKFYFLTEHLLKKIFLFIIDLFDKGYEVVIFNISFENNYMYIIEKKIYDFLESFNIKTEQSILKNNYDIEFFSVFNPINIKSRKSIFLKCKDFFSKPTIDQLKNNKKIKSKIAQKYFNSEYYKEELRHYK